MIAKEQLGSDSGGEKDKVKKTIFRQRGALIIKNAKVAWLVLVTSKLVGNEHFKEIMAPQSLITMKVS